MKLELGQLGAQLRKDGKEFPAEIRRGAYRAAQRGRALLARRGPVDQGQFKAGWRARQTPDGAELANDAPHAGVLERGARPHAVNEAGRQALYDWVMRVLRPQAVSGPRGGSSAEAVAKRIVGAICAKLAKEGQVGLFIVRDALDELSAQAREEIERELGAHHGGGR